ncbi:hypothetical protein SUT007_18280 [Streptococcus parasuis]|nr:hypothetical protein SUT007_18280 [Streptococcus parasuis]
MKKKNQDEDQITLDNLPYRNDDRIGFFFFFFFLMIRPPPRSTRALSSAASDVYKRQNYYSVSDFKLDELDYFNRISTPRLDYTKVIVNDGQLDFNILLKPNEIRLIEIIKI